MSAPERRDPQDAVFAPEELLRALPTPCYVYDEAQLRTRAARLRSAFSWSAGFRAWFPVRALPNPTVLRILREEGQGALCVTAGEYRLALASGFSPESIRFAPEFPTDAELAVPAADLVLDDGGLLLRLERERPLPARLGQRLLPECRRGARLVLHDVGAYGASMGYSYGLTPHCAEYLYQADGTLRCIRRAQRED